jgi:hypothetical protein
MVAQIDGNESNSAPFNLGLTCRSCNASGGQELFCKGDLEIEAGRWDGGVLGLDMSDLL